VTNAAIATVGWARDTRDSILYPTIGQLQRVFVETGLPGMDLEYYKTNLQEQVFFPLFSPFTLALNGEFGMGNGYRGKPLPFFKNFYAGGVSSVRGYDTNSLGPQDSNGDILGGRRRIVGNSEVLFPLPGTKGDKSVRTSLFFDAGQIRGDGTQSDLESFRYSTGVAVAWQSPMGLLKISFGEPLRKKATDKIQRFQFQFGNTF
jgi:outer membrane protein insertion porin family